MIASARRAGRLLLASDGLPLVWVLLSVLVLVPVWGARLLPMLDTPNHLALARAWHSHSDPSFNLAEFYDLRVRPVPYILFYGALHLLMYVVEIETANKLVLSAYLLAFPLALLALARALGRSPWLAVAGFVLAFNQNWIYGFTSYLLGTVGFFFSLACLVRYLDEGRPRTLAWVAVAALATYFGHILPWFCLGVCFLALATIEVSRAGQLARLLRLALALLPSLIFAVAAIVEDRAEQAYMTKGEGFAATFRDFPTSVLDFPRRVLELFPGPLDMLVLGLVAVTSLGLWVAARPPAEDPALRRLKALAWTLALLYLSLPSQITKPLYWWYVAQRLPSLLAPLLVLLPSVAPRGLKRILLVPMLVGCVVLPVKLVTLYRDFSWRNAGFLRLLAEIPRGASTLVITKGMATGPGSEEQSGDKATSAPVYWHFSSWPAALHGGFDPYVFEQGIPVRVRNRLPAPQWSRPEFFDLRRAPDFDYYLVRDVNDGLDREPALRLVDRVNDWSLHQRVGPITEEP